VSRERCTGLGCGIEDGRRRDMNIYLKTTEKVGLGDISQNRAAGTDSISGASSYQHLVVYLVR